MPKMKITVLRSITGFAGMAQVGYYEFHCGAWL